MDVKDPSVTDCFSSYFHVFSLLYLVSPRSFQNPYAYVRPPQVCCSLLLFFCFQIVDLEERKDTMLSLLSTRRQDQRETEGVKNKKSKGTRENVSLFLKAPVRKQVERGSISHDWETSRDFFCFLVKRKQKIEINSRDLLDIFVFNIGREHRLAFPSWAHYYRREQDDVYPRGVSSTNISSTSSSSFFFFLSSFCCLVRSSLLLRLHFWTRCHRAVVCGIFIAPKYCHHAHNRPRSHCWLLFSSFHRKYKNPIYFSF